MADCRYGLNGDENLVLEALALRFKIVAESHGEFAMVYFDTFDWRLHQAERRLVEVRQNGKSSSELCQVDGTLLASGGGVPRFAWDFPPGPMRQILEPLVEMRALLPVARLHGRRALHAVLDGREKTIARIEFFAPEVEGADGSRLALRQRLIVHCLKGFARAARRLCRFLEGRCGLTPLREELFAESLTALGRRPGEYSSKIDLSLTASMPAAVAVRQILRHLFQTLRLNQPGVEDALDSEFLHDFRVAVRRTRVALAQFRTVLPAREVEHFRQEFAWLGTLTSPARDLDVYLLGFPKFQAGLPPAERDDLVPFRRFLERHWEREYQQLTKQLRSPRYVRLLSNWDDFLQRPEDPEATPDGMRPIAEVVARRCWKIYRRVLREGQAIGPQSPPSDLHELRKTCKKFRYLMEFFQSLYPADRIGRLIKALKGLQDHLGAFQDLHVQVETLRRFSQELAEEGEAPAATLLALGRLVEGFDRRQGEVREEFSERFSSFAVEENQQVCRTLFKPQAREPA